MTMRVADFLSLPTDVGTDAFIVRLDEADVGLRKQRIREYVLPKEVERQLDAMLKVVGERLAQKRDVGRFVYGSFGSGKSHLMLVLARMLAGDESVYELGDAGLRRLRQTHTWLGKDRVLVVPINMMGKKSLSRAIYEAYNAALPPEVEKAQFANHERIFEIVEAKADEMLGGIEGLKAKLVESGVLPRAAFYDTNRNGSLEQRLDLASKVWRWWNAGRADDAFRADDMWLDPNDGFSELSRHAKEAGFATVAFQIDELIIWIREKTRAEYIREINTLSALVDHDGAANRPVPFFVAVAVQRDIAETCPEDLSESDFRQHLRFVANRFEPSLKLEDTDLYEVCQRRVLRPRNDEKEIAFNAEVDRVMAQNAAALETLAADVRPEDVRALYPFHPALIRVLMDVTQAFSRSRTGVQILYALLVEYAKGLEVGQFVPLGSLFDAIFTPDNVSALRQNVKGSFAQQLLRAWDAYEKLQPLLKASSKTEADCPWDATWGCSRCLSQRSGDEYRRCLQLNQVLKSVLLCQLSQHPFFHGGKTLAQSITVRNLLRLNLADIRASAEMSGAIRLLGLLRDLQGQTQQLRVTGSNPEALVAIETQAVNTDEVLEEAVQRVQHADRVAFLRTLLDDELGLSLGSSMEASRTVSWRGTKRKGTVRLCNVRTLTYAGQRNDFEPSDGFLLLVDLPFDEDPTKGSEDDVETLQRAKTRKRQWTLAWLPKHFDDVARKALTRAAAIELIRGDQRKYLQDRFRTSEAAQALQQLSNFQAAQADQLRGAIRKVYFLEGQLQPLQDGVETGLATLDPARAVETVALRVLDARWPQHPRFPRNVDRGGLSTVLSWVVRSALQAERVDVATAQLPLVDQVALPLELVHRGEASVTARADGKYVARVTEWTRGKTEFQARDLREWLMGDGGPGFGLTKEVADALLFYVQQVEGYEALGPDGKGLTIDDLGGMPADFRLRKDEVVDNATWQAARKAAQLLLRLQQRSDVPTSPEQAKLSRDTDAAAREGLGRLNQLATHLDSLFSASGTPKEGSQRLGTVLAGISHLDELSATVSNAERVKRLARLASPPAGLPGLLSEAANEVRAAQQLVNLKTQIGTVRLHGTEAEGAVIGRLATLLKDPVTLRIADAEPALRGDIETAFQAVMARIRTVPPEPPTPPEPRPPEPPKPDDGEKRAAGSRTAVSKKDLARVASEIAGGLATELGGERFDVEVTLKRKS